MQALTDPDLILQMLKRLVLSVLVGPAVLLGAFAAYVGWAGAHWGESTCRGTVVSGSLVNGQRPPLYGANYRAYSLPGFLLGRTFMHSAVRKTVEDAYDEVAKTHPELHFIYAESGWPWGGPFAPHKSHANGTAVDFHVPVRDGQGAVSEIPTGFASKLGYGVEFDRHGHFGDLTIDFEAIALHLLALHEAAAKNGIAIRRVIFDPPLQPLLFAAKDGVALHGKVEFSKSRSWVRHDEHYHVDFAVPCR